MASLLAHRPVVLGFASLNPRTVSASNAEPLRPVRAVISRHVGFGGSQLQAQGALHAPRRRRAIAASAGPQPLFEAAFVMPGVAVTLFRAATAGVGVYCLLQWRTFRNTRKQVEHMIDDNKVKSAARAERLKRLQPAPPPPSDDEDQAGA